MVTAKKKEIAMRKHFVPMLVAATALAGLAVAGPIDKKETIKLDREALVGAQLLPSGLYKVELGSEPETVRFVQAGKTVLEVPCKLGLDKVVYPGNAVHFKTAETGPDRLTKIVLADSKLAIEVEAPASVGQDEPVAAADRR